ncbi:magnesium transporter [Kaarinaea lacus]
METSAEKRSHDSLQHNLQQIRELLDKQHLVEAIVHFQERPRSDIVESLVHRQHSVELKKRIRKLHIADIADLLEVLPLEDRKLIWQHLESQQAADVLMEVSDPVRENVVANMHRSELLQLLNFLDADDLAYIAEDIPEDILNERLKSLPSEDRDWLHSAMTYPEDTVGYLMSNEMVVVREHQTLQQAQKHLRDLTELPSHNDKLFVLDQRGLLTGALSLQSILLNDPDAKVIDVMAKEVVRFAPLDSANEAASAFERYDLVSAPVVNERGKLMGRLTVDLVMEYVREESSENVLNIAGMAEEEDLYAPIIDSAKNRGTWLTVNLFATFIAASIIGMFENTIGQLVALAALMPIIASVGGNSGNQTTAIVIRGLALGQISQENTMRLLKKEIGISLLNGAMLGVIVGCFAFLLYQNLYLGIVISVALMVTLVFAAALGFLVPLLLQKVGRDPALGSSVLQTAITDSMAFFIFLGLATVFLI